jgi:hypothetical protein
MCESSSVGGSIITVLFRFNHARRGRLEQIAAPFFADFFGAQVSSAKVVTFLPFAPSMVQKPHSAIGEPGQPIRIEATVTIERTFP